MERLEGTVLSEILEVRGQLPIQEAVRYILQAAEGVAEAHRLGIVHRDLKPANMFVVDVEGRSVLKVFDFGASKITEDSALQAGDAAVTRENSLIGSPRYMAPEQLRSVLQVDSRVDVYALGMTLHEMLAGEPMFDGRSLEDILAKVLWEKPRSLTTYRSDIPDELDAVVLRCLEKGKRERFQNVEELVAGLCKFATGRYSRSVMRMKARAMMTPPQPFPVPEAVKASVAAATTLSISASGEVPAMLRDPFPDRPTLPPEPPPGGIADEARRRTPSSASLVISLSLACGVASIALLGLRARGAEEHAHAAEPDAPIVAERRMERLPSVVLMPAGAALAPASAPSSSAPRDRPAVPLARGRRRPRLRSPRRRRLRPCRPQRRHQPLCP